MIEKSVVRTDVDYLTVQFSADADTRQWWQTEFWGKWMHSSVPYASYVRSPRLNASIERSVSDIISYQRPSGYIGNYKDEARCDRGWDVWGMKYTMMGLMFYSDGAKDPEKKKKALLQRLKSVRKIKEASVEELCMVDEINEELAQRILYTLE